MSAPSVRHPGEFRWETRLLAVVTLSMTAFGIINCYSTGAYLTPWLREAMDQVVAAVIGGILFLAAARADYQIWRRAAKPLFYLTLGGLAFIAFVAVVWKTDPSPFGWLVPRRNFARRWLQLGPVTVQLSELARFTLTAYVAMRAAQIGKRIGDFRHGYLVLLAPVALTALFVYLEPNLSMAILLGVSGALVMFTAGARISHLLPTALVAAAVVAMALSVDFRSERVEDYGKTITECPPREQVCEALIGVGRGGVRGVGFGEGTQKLGHLTYAYSDFILSAIAEEFGLVGISATMLMFAIFCWMGFRIAKTARDPFGMFLAAGLTATVGIAAFLHAAVVLSMIPPTGLTLPFISAGRVSLIMYLFSAGVVVSVGRRRGRPARER